MEEKINLKNFTLFSSKKNIEIQSIAYSFNLFLPTLILIISSFFKNYNLTAELGILIGINIIFTQIFSSNARSIIIAKKLISSIFSYIIFRVIISIIIILINIIFFNYLEFTNNLILLLISVMIILQWLIELILTSIELRKKIHLFYYYNFFSLTFVVLIFIDFIFFRDLKNIIFIYNLLLFSFFCFSFLRLKKNKINIKKIFLLSINSKAFYSSFSVSVANLIWRILIIFFCGKILAGIYFASFAIGSLPGTLFNNTFGPTMLKNNIKLKSNFKFLLYFFILLLIILFGISLINLDKIFINFSYTQIFGTFISLLGSIFMIKGLYFRQFLIQKTSQKSRVFKVDILYSFFVVLIVPTLFLLGGEKLIIISFLISSLISYFTYKHIKSKILKN
ncbi:hypothetical protein N8212_00775 [Pelagibacteraceae bacterium]|nr:hypothetical protein [Pelagibacteraceae bacterium]